MNIIPVNIYIYNLHVINTPVWFPHRNHITGSISVKNNNVKVKFHFLQ